MPKHQPIKQRWGNLHTHSNFSVLDGMSTVKRLVAKAALDGQPFIGLTDHGNMAGTVQLYRAAREHNIAPFPGVEAYLIDPDFDGSLADKEAGKVPRFHLGLLARSQRGYHGLVRLVSLTHTRPRFNRFPRMQLEDLIEFGEQYGEDVILTSGCFFGLAQQTMMRRGDSATERVLKMYAHSFPHTFVEVQHHNIVHTPEQDEAQNIITDDALVAGLFGLADKLGLPVIATQDCHYTDQREKKAHALMKRMVYGGAEDEFPGDSFHFASAEWVGEHYTPGQWDRVLESADATLALNKVVIPPLDVFQAHVPSMVKNPQQIITKAVKAALPVYLAASNRQRYQKRYEARLDYELSVINDLGMASYFMIWLDFVQWCRKEKIAIEARGSANGSLVNFLMKITQVDPVRWNCLFERFLSRDRIKPPDIDMDIEDSRRPEAIAYLLSKYEAVQIGTWGKLGARGEDDRGSVLVSWLASKRRETAERASDYLMDKADREGSRKPTQEAIKSYGAAIFARTYGHVESIEDVAQISREDYIGLRTLAKMDSAYRSYGVHAGGVLLSGDDVKISDYVPTMLVASSDTRASQYDMDDVEELGLLKMDVLGQATLRTMRICQELMGREDPCDFTWIPEDDPKACALLRDGRTDTGIFHFEGYTKSKGGKELGVKTTKDAVLVQALYMPGAMNTGQTDLYNKYRHRPELRSRIKYIHPIFEEVLSETFGAVVFQEQVIEIMRKMGMGIAGINKFFKVVKDSGKGATERNRGRMAEVREEFDKLCADKGIDPDAAWAQTAGFVEYGFNRAHATGYGVRSYRCAYLKAYYPLEFMTALLQTWAGDKKEAVYIREARRISIRVGPPDVNMSGSSWSMDKRRGNIRKGLVSIAGIGEAAAVEIVNNRPYASITDIIDRCSKRAVSGGDQYRKDGSLIGTLKKLYEAGALDQLEHEQR